MGGKVKRPGLTDLPFYWETLRDAVMSDSRRRMVAEITNRYIQPTLPVERNPDGLMSLDAFMDLVNYRLEMRYCPLRTTMKASIDWRGGFGPDAERAVLVMVRASVPERTTGEVVEVAAGKAYPADQIQRMTQKEAVRQVKRQVVDLWEHESLEHFRLDGEIEDDPHGPPQAWYHEKI